MKGLNVVKQGEGPITLVIGHSGTDHFFPQKEVENMFASPIIEKVI